MASAGHPSRVMPKFPVELNFDETMSYNRNFGFKNFTKMTVVSDIEDTQLFKEANPKISHVLADFAKYKKEILWNPDEEALHKAYSTLDKHFSMIVNGAEPISFDQAIEAMDKNKSPGFPWNLKYQTKRDVLENHKDWLFNHIFDIFCGVDYETFWAIFGKHEFRPKEKVDAGKIRSVCSSPIEHQLVETMLYATQDFKLMSQHCSVSKTTAGFTPYQGGWNDLMTGMFKYDKVYVVDYTKFDSRQHTNLKYLIHQMRVKHLPAEYRQAAEWAFFTGTQSLCVMPNGVYDFKTHGQNSGDYLTLTNNSLLNQLNFLYCFYRHTNFSEMSISEINDYVDWRTHGDDNFFACNNNTDFSPLHLIKYGAELGLEMDPHDGHTETPTTLNYIGYSNLVFEFENGKNIILPLYDINKAKTTVHYNKSTDVLKYCSKLASLRILCFPHLFIKENKLFYNQLEAQYNHYMDLNAHEPVVAKMHEARKDYSALFEMYVGDITFLN